jgi:hypothetical protein
MNELHKKSLKILLDDQDPCIVNITSYGLTPEQHEQALELLAETITGMMHVEKTKTATGWLYTFSLHPPETPPGNP